MTSAIGGSPYLPEFIKHGIHNASRTSNISLGYSLETLSTPWPYLIINSTLAFFVALMTLYTSWSSYWSVHSGLRSLPDDLVRNHRVMLYVSFFISSFRAFFAFIGACAKVPLEHAPLPSAILILATSIWPYWTLRTNATLLSRLRWLALLFMLLLALAVPIARPFPSAKNNDYHQSGSVTLPDTYGGQWVTTGSSSAIFVDNCTVALVNGTYTTDLPGAYDPSSASAPSQNLLGKSEQIWCYIAFAIIFLELLVIEIDRRETDESRIATIAVARVEERLADPALDPREASLARKRQEEIEERERLGGKRPSTIAWMKKSIFSRWESYKKRSQRSRELFPLTEKDLRFNVIISSCATLLIMMVAVASTVVQWHGQTHATTVFAVDGSNSTAPGQAWVDCFEIPVPVDGNGFLGKWLNVQRSKVVNLLGMV